MASLAHDSARREATCAGCGADYPGASWASLALTQRIEAPEIGLLLSAWPEGFCIEVRACRRCSRPIAMKRAKA